MATLEKVTIKIYPMNESYKPYVLTFEHAAPNFVARKLLGAIADLLRAEFIAEGAENIRIEKP